MIEFRVASVRLIANTKVYECNRAFGRYHRSERGNATVNLRGEPRLLCEKVRRAVHTGTLRARGSGGQRLPVRRDSLVLSGMDDVIRCVCATGVRVRIIRVLI